MGQSRRLGEVVSCHSTTLAAKGSVKTLLICLASGLGLAFMVWAFGASAFEDRGTRGVTKGLGVLFLLSLCIGVPTFLHFVRRWSKRVYVCERGLRFTGLLGPRRVLWEEVSRVFRARTFVVGPSGLVLEDRGSLTLETTDGRRLRVKDLERWDRLLDTVDAATQASILERLRTRWRAGKVLDFGALEVDREGVACDQHFLPWDRIRHVSSHNGTLSINGSRLKRRGRGGIQVPVGEVANAALCLHWIRTHMRQPKAASAR